MTQKTLQSDPVHLFYSYSHADEALRDELDKHLSILRREGVLSEWHDRRITAGSEWSREISDNLENAQIILLLISSDFVASNYCYDIEMKRALEKHESGEARVIPIIVRSVDWLTAPFAKLQVLPRGGKLVDTWDKMDEAWLDVAKGIRCICGEILSKKEKLEQLPPPGTGQRRSVPDSTMDVTPRSIPIVTFYGTKGGTGKTTISTRFCQLALARDQSTRLLYVDADFDHRGATILFGQLDRNRTSLHDYLKDPLRLRSSTMMIWSR